MFHETLGAVKARTVRRQVPLKQWNRELLLALGLTPWDSKGKDEVDTTFVLPPDLGMTGRICSPRGLELPTEGRGDKLESTEVGQQKQELELSTPAAVSETRRAL